MINKIIQTGSKQWDQLFAGKNSARCCTCHLLMCLHPITQTDEWRLSEVNKDFSVCPSYPPLVAVPKDVDDDTLRKVATFRHSGRFPVLSYYHKKNGMVSLDCFCSVLLRNGWQYHSTALLPLLIKFSNPPSTFRWWCEQASLSQAPMGGGVRKTRSWLMPRCGQANAATSLTRAPSM